MLRPSLLILPLLLSITACVAEDPALLDCDSDRCDELGAVDLGQWPEGADEWTGQEIEVGQVYTFEVDGAAGELDLSLPKEYTAGILRAYSDNDRTYGQEDRLLIEPSASPVKVFIAVDGPQNAIMLNMSVDVDFGL